MSLNSARIVIGISWHTLAAMCDAGEVTHRVRQGKRYRMVRIPISEVRRLRGELVRRTRVLSGA